MKKTSIFLLVFLLLGAFYTLALAEKNFFSPAHTTKDAKVFDNHLSENPNPSPAVDPAPNLSFSTPARVIGAYSTSWIAGSPKIDQIVQFIKQSGINALVIDLKDDTGVISYKSSVPLAQEIGASSNRIANIKELVTRLKQEKIYLIGRIVVFKDPLLATKHQELAVKDKNGGLWRDRKGMIWVDPDCRKVWKYNQDIAKEAVGLGFSEIQFDYVRFLSDGKLVNCVYPYSNGELKEDVIHDFLLSSKKELNSMGVPLSADVFGLVLSVPDDLNIGQKLEKIAPAVDYISPMVYPSHYPRGSFGFNDPDSYPYEVISKAMQFGTKRLKNDSGKLRPWIQDFSLQHTYGRLQLEQQIKALRDTGVHDYLLWNPSNRYELSKYPALN
jgi:Uncharacterized conserved protein